VGITVVWEGGRLTCGPCQGWQGIFHNAKILGAGGQGKRVFIVQLRRNDWFCLAGILWNRFWALVMLAAGLYRFFDLIDLVRQIGAVSGDRAVDFLEQRFHIALGPAIGPFDPAIRANQIVLAQQHHRALEAATGCQLIYILGQELQQRGVDAYDHARLVLDQFQAFHDQALDLVQWLALQ
jgi:hypothetical protein